MIKVLKLNDLFIDPKSLGSKLLLVDVTPVYEYTDGKRTDNLTGHRYTVALPEKAFEKIGVKIEGPQLLEKPDGFVEVVFDGLEIYAYLANGQIQIGARAKGVHRVQVKP